MQIWLVMFGLALVAAGALYWGGTTVAARPAGSRREGDMAIYTDQLAEIERDVASGLFSQAEAEGQRTEISRKLLQAATQREADSTIGSRALAIALALAVPIVAFLIYAEAGAPGMPDLPLQERLATSEQRQDLPAMIYKVERHLARNPEDVSGWEILIPSYNALGRFGDVATAYRNIMAVKGPTPDMLADMAEALVFAGDGVMPPDAIAAVQEALVRDPMHPKAAYYDAIGLSQQGKRDVALRRFEALLARTPADAPWRSAVEGQIADLRTQTAKAPQLSQEQLGAAEGMSAGDQQQMIRGMVDGLAEKLAVNPNDLQGWLRLIRARTVLKDVEIAKSSLATARQTFQGNATALADLDALALELSLK